MTSFLVAKQTRVAHLQSIIMITSFYFTNTTFLHVISFELNLRDNIKVTLYLSQLSFMI